MAIETLLDKADASDMTNSSLIAVVRITALEDVREASVNFGPNRDAIVDRVWINNDPDRTPIRSTIAVG